MTTYNRKTIKTVNQPNYTLYYYLRKNYLLFRLGFIKIIRAPIRIIVPAGLLTMAFIVIRYCDNDTKQSIIPESISYVLAATVLLMVFLLSILLLGVSSRAGNPEHDYFRIGLVNALQEPPLLYDYRQDKKKLIVRYIYNTNGIPLEEWQGKTGSIETVLNRDIISIQYYKDKAHVLIVTVPKGSCLPINLKWKDALTPREEFVLLLGESLVGPVTVDLNRIPHILIGGATGSGKTILLKSLLRQCVLKDAHVVLADFKGGLDYDSFSNDITILTERNLFAEHLKAIVTVMGQRKQKLAEAGCANIREYNERFGSELNHIVLACDELAEVTDKTGEPKTGKEEIDKIIGYLSTIARLGRAYGIHLLLGMQRADANVVPGQIRNNVGYRVCGYAPDRILADITLDNPEAVDKLKNNVIGTIPGRFVDNSCTLFQGYLL